MDKRKRTKIDVTATLRALDSGDTCTIIIAGTKRQASLQALYKARKKHGLAVSINTTENGTKAIITAL